MLGATEMGAVVMPPVPAFYTRPRTIQDIVEHTVARALDLFDIDVPGIPRWSGQAESAATNGAPLPTVSHEAPGRKKPDQVRLSPVNAGPCLCEEELQ
jgi:hypothetical protein